MNAPEFCHLETHRTSTGCGINCSHASVQNIAMCARVCVWNSEKQCFKAGTLCDQRFEKMPERNDDDKGKNRQGKCTDIQAIWSTNQLFVCAMENDNHSLTMHALSSTGTQRVGKHCAGMTCNSALHKHCIERTMITKARMDKGSVLTPSTSGQPISCLFVEQKTDNHVVDKILFSVFVARMHVA